MAMLKDNFSTTESSLDRQNMDDLQNEKYQNGVGKIEYQKMCDDNSNREIQKEVQYKNFYKDFENNMQNRMQQHVTSVVDNEMNKRHSIDQFVAKNEVEYKKQ